MVIVVAYGMFEEVSNKEAQENVLTKFYNRGRM